MAANARPFVRSAEELEALVMEIGFLPFVHCGIEGFSVQERTPTDLWFVRDVVGPWEWRETITDRGNLIYAKLFQRKAGFVSPAWYPDFVNWRRSGLSFDERYAQGMIPRAEKLILDMLRKQGPMLSRDLKREAPRKGFEGALLSLQMRTDVVIQRFERRISATGEVYGMGTTRYAPAEMAIDPLLLDMRLHEAPEASYKRLYAHISGLFPSASDKAIHRLIT